MAAIHRCQWYTTPTRLQCTRAQPLTFYRFDSKHFQGAKDCCCFPVHITSLYGRCYSNVKIIQIRNHCLNDGHPSNSDFL